MFRIQNLKKAKSEGREDTNWYYYYPRIKERSNFTHELKK